MGKRNLTKSEAMEKRWKNPEYREKMQKQNKLRLSKINKDRKGKSYEKIYGFEKAKQIREKMTKTRTGMQRPEQFKKEESKRCLKEGIERDIRLKNLLKNKGISPNEQKLLGIINRNNLPFNFVGDGKVIFNGFCPDFLSKNPKHIIELNGGNHYQSARKERDRRKLKAYSLLGYKTLTIWNNELNNEQKVVQKIREFIK